MGFQLHCCADHQPGWVARCGHHPGDAESLLQPPPAVPGGTSSGGAVWRRSLASVASCTYRIRISEVRSGQVRSGQSV